MEGSAAVTTMLKKAARAAHDAAARHGEAMNADHPVFGDIARAALMAVRDIDGGIERAAEAMDSPGHPTPAYRHFHLAIDAILADGEEG